MKKAFYQNRFVILSLFIVLFMFVIVMFVDEAGQQAAQRQQEQAQSVQKVSLGGPFQLQTHAGQVFTEQNLLNKFSLIFFGYTYCPDICPDTLSRMVEVYEQLSPAQQQQVQVLFVSVDPARDTQTALAEYVHAFHADFIGLRGTEEQINTIVDAYKVYYAKREEEGRAPDDYLVDHSGFIFLMGPDGQYRAHFSHKTAPAEFIQKLQSFI